MTSERQIAANRANALHSTGPRTPEGKAAVRHNALRHGLLARDVVLPDEDFDAFEDLRNRVRADLSPMGPIEELLADRVVSIMWRLGRSARIETALFDWRVRELQVSRLAAQVRSHELTLADYSFPSHITDKVAHTEATEALARAKDERDRDEVLLGRAVDADANESGALGNLARYEAGLERSLFRNLDDSANARIDAGTVPRPRFWMPLRSLSAIQNDHRSMHSSERGPKQAIWPGNCSFHFSFVAGEKFVFAKQSHLARDAQFSAGNSFGQLAPIITGYLVEATGNFNPAFVLAGALALVGATVTRALARTPIGEVRTPAMAQPRLAD